VKSVRAQRANLQTEVDLGERSEGERHGGRF
jgi:hypothetical protein